MLMEREMTLIGRGTSAGKNMVRVADAIHTVSPVLMLTVALMCFRSLFDARSANVRLSSGPSTLLVRTNRSEIWPTANAFGEWTFVAKSSVSSGRSFSLQSRVRLYPGICNTACPMPQSKSRSGDRGIALVRPTQTHDFSWNERSNTQRPVWGLRNRPLIRMNSRKRRLTTGIAACGHEEGWNLTMVFLFLYLRMTEMVSRCLRIKVHSSGGGKGSKIVDPPAPFTKHASSCNGCIPFSARRR